MTEWAIETSELGQCFDDNWAIRGLNLQVPRGSVFGLLGENGAGKSTTIQTLMGLLLPSEGSVSVLGFDPKTDDVAIKSNVGYVAEKHGFYEQMRISEIIAFIGAYHRNWNDQLCDELLNEFSLEPDVRIKSLSKGMRAKLALLLALSFEPDMLLLDEPASGLDPAARRNFIETILSRYQQTGKTIVLSSHLLNEFSGLLDHVAFIRHGKIDLASPTEQLHQDMKRVRLVFDQGVPEQLNMPGLISIESSGREAVAIIDKFQHERSMAALSHLNASHISVEELSLEDIFVVRACA
ncbi:MAG TPA: ABC transporter ATP-binding protein [Gammaproteobacteria bacterium]|nr:ABC transporter ATP-binding protein [Gammaproteobacteria bacterium]HIL98903.1 ABC transporter ATP-binding protein [Pseudomonadales bacterium]